MPTEKEITYGCMNNYFFLATATQHNGKQVIICGENMETCKYARRNGVLRCTAAEAAKNQEALLEKIIELSSK